MTERTTAQRAREDPASEGAMRLSKLTLPREEMRSLGYAVVDALVEHFEGLPDAPVARRHPEASRLQGRLHEPAPESPTHPERVLEQLQSDVFSSMMHSDHPRFFGYIPGPSNFVGAMADALAAGLNVFAGTWADASGPAALELATLDWLREICGMPASAGGIFVSGGSMANLTALAVARHTLLPGGHFADAVVYYSDQTHSSIERGLMLLGFKRSQLRELPSDEALTLDPARLRCEIAANRGEGRRPFCVVANAGTTNTGAVDPLSELTAICRQEGMWLHADGAYGASAVLTAEGADALAGLDLVDSLAIDPHKWLFQPYEIGCVLVRDARRMRDTFKVRPDYLRDLEREAEGVNFCDYGPQLSRSFRALKLWMSLKVFGLAAFRAAIAHGMASASLTEEKLRRADRCWEIVSPAQLGILCFRYAPSGWRGEDLDALNQRVADELAATGYAFPSTTVLHGRIVLRMCTINPRTTYEDIEGTVRLLTEIGTRLSGRRADADARRPLAGVA